MKSAYCSHAEKRAIYSSRPAQPASIFIYLEIALQTGSEYRPKYCSCRLSWFLVDRRSLYLGKIF
jgi:hypothetical protein